MAYRLGIDSGGTFVDVVLFEEETGNLKITKTPSTPKNPSIGVYNGIVKIIEKEGIDPLRISSLVHGTTVATNALLEYKGVTTALILTQRFKDILSIVRQDRPKLYDYFVRRPDPLVPRHLRFEVRERTLFNGDILEDLNDSEILGIIDQIKSLDIRTVAACFLHSYANPRHELRVKELFQQDYPEAAVSLSCEILPEIREYERMSTTVINAYVMPIIERYLLDLMERMKNAGLRVDLNVMQSNGGIMTAGSAGQKSVATILSGPAGGVIGSQGISLLGGCEDVITLDMGGTSCDICLINKGKFLTTKESEIGGHAVKVPMIDINTIGAGGGSIAWIDAGGLLRVGPQSAGADPGPACYGKRGTEPTVTDANLVLGRLNPDFYVGGEMHIDVGLAKTAIQQKIAEPLNLGLEEAAEGVLKVVNANMIRGIRRVSVERGHDPRQYSLFCFGGGGPLHGADLATELNVPRLIIPIGPGVNSAVGLLMADFRYDYSRTYLKKVSQLEFQDLNVQFEVLEKQAFQQMVEEKIPKDKILFHRSADMRYFGQGYEIDVPVPGGLLTHDQVEGIRRSFNQIHAQLYGYNQPHAEMEIVYLRLAAIGQIPKPRFSKTPAAEGDASTAFKGKRKVYMDGRYLDTSLYDRSRLKPNHRIEGPAIVEQFDSTTLIKPGQSAGVDPYLNLIVQIKRS
jgi:N-methylhydantoinase A